MNTPIESKAKILAALTAMPDEAFGWVVIALSRRPVFPDGLGGFQDESRRAIIAFTRAIAEYPGQ